MIERPRRVVLLIDYDNLQICAARDTPGRELQLPPVVQLAQRYGTVILARAYAEWNLSTERLAVYKAGIEPAFAPVLRTESDRSGKSLADTVMVAEGMDMLWTLAPDVVVLATSDKDLIPLVRVAKQRGAFVVVLGSDFTAIPLREMADDHVTYRQLISEPAGRFATEAGLARQPAALPEPARRRSRERTSDRPGRDRTPILAPATGTTPPPATPLSRTERPPERTETPRPERESSPAPVVTSLPMSAVTSSEAVPPVAAGPAGDTELQAGGRRRRRRGSRRRSERLGLAGEGYAMSEGGGSESHDIEDANDGGSYATDELEITPTASIVEVGPANRGTAESAPDLETNGVGPVPSTGGPAETSDGAPAPRSRRRRTRLASSADVSSAANENAVGEPGLITSPPGEPTVNLSSGGETPGADESSTEGDDAAPASRRPRARRVTSAARGRSSSSR